MKYYHYNGHLSYLSSSLRSRRLPFLTLEIGKETLLVNRLSPFDLAILSEICIPVHIQPYSIYRTLWTISGRYK